MKTETSLDHIWKLLERVKDPEVPVLTVLDLGIIRDVKEIEEEVSGKKEKRIEVVITPTYTGCPAMNVISMTIKIELAAEGYPNTKVTEVLSPAWTTAWMTEEGKRKLKEYGIAPPQEGTIDVNTIFSDPKPVPCPLCESTNTRMVSQFGSTACKAMFQCNDCKEPFDYFKCH